MLKKCSKYRVILILFNCLFLVINYLKTSCKNYTRIAVFNIHYTPKHPKDLLNPFSEYNCNFDLQNNCSKEFSAVIMGCVRKKVRVYCTFDKLFGAAHRSHGKTEKI